MLDREGVAGPEEIAIVGSQDEVVDRIGALADIGVTEFAGCRVPRQSRRGRGHTSCGQGGDAMTSVCASRPTIAESRRSRSTIRRST